jgi:low affinity Fe/Cu permease
MGVFEHPAERGGGERAGGPFERFSQAASNFTSSPVFYGICVALVVAFVAVHAARVSGRWELALTGGMSAVTLMLLALLKNSESQTEHAIQTKLDAIGRLLLAPDGADRRRAQQELANAIRHDTDM